MSESKELVRLYAEHLRASGFLRFAKHEGDRLEHFADWLREQGELNCKPQNLPAAESGGRAGGEQSPPVSMNTQLPSDACRIFYAQGMILRKETAQPPSEE